jgi:ATP-dependent 26S proteasome regulatory subunit
MPLLIITPSEFLSNGLEQIYVRVHEIFEDLMDVSAAVILFAEMDALARTREDVTEVIDVTRQLLTTSMLPKLSNLWDQGRVIFLMATNHKEQLDVAITRPGRFDLLLCVGPPPWANKLEGLAEVVKDLPSKDVPETKKLLRSISESTNTQSQLDMFTVSELRSFLDQVNRRKNTTDLLNALKLQDKKEFEKAVEEWATSVIALSQTNLKEESTNDLKASRRQ